MIWRKQLVRDLLFAFLFICVCAGAGFFSSYGLDYLHQYFKPHRLERVQP